MSESEDPQPLYSIRIPASPATVACPRCQKEFRAVGPTGFADDEAICDLCLLKADQQLGMVLAVIWIVRVFARSCPVETEDLQKPISQLLAGGDPRSQVLSWMYVFVFSYHCFASQYGPVREFVAEPPANS